MRSIRKSHLPSAVYGWCLCGVEVDERYCNVAQNLYADTARGRIISNEANHLPRMTAIASARLFRVISFTHARARSE